MANGRATIWKQKSSATPIPAGLKNHAFARSNLSAAMTECEMPQPGQGIPKSLFIRQKWGTWGMIGTNNKTTNVEINMAR
jgi:hypothetical protein